MNHYFKGQTYNQRVEALKCLLKTFGRLDPPGAAKTVQDFTERLAADIQKGHLDCAVQETTR